MTLQAGVFSSCCLALDSSSSFPCPAFRAIAKSLLSELLREPQHVQKGDEVETK
ncbi:hypothetical protein STEG23_013006, partial [Scotinomys teguina]